LKQKNNGKNKLALLMAKNAIRRWYTFQLAAGAFALIKAPLNLLHIKNPLSELIIDLIRSL
jgi:hypothetical protein